MFYMDDLKVFAKNEAILSQMLSVVNDFSNDICMKFGLDKCAKINLKRGKLTTSENIEIDTHTVIQDLEPGKTYKYLGIEECETISNDRMKERIRREYYRRVRLVLQSALNSRNKISAIGSLAVPVAEYSFGLVDWTEQEIRTMDRKTRKLLTMHHVSHPRADVHRLYVSRKEGGRGLRQIEASWHNAIVGMGKYVVSHQDDPLMRQVMKSDRRMGNRGIVSVARNIAKKTRQDTSNNTDTELLMLLNMKCETQKMLKKSWRDKPLHGQYLKRMDKVQINKDQSFMWLKRGRMKPESEALVIAAQDQALRTRHYDKAVLKISQDDKCRICQEHVETIDHIVSACPILAKTEYLKRHDRVCSYLHWQICTALEVPNTCPKWYEHSPKPVTSVGLCTILYDQQIQTDRTIAANKPDIVIRDLAKKSCLLIDVAVPCDQNVVTKEAEKRLKYKSLEIEISRMWGVKAQVVPIVIGALGFVPQNLSKNLSKLPGNSKDWEVQEIALFGTAHILRKVL